MGTERDQRATIKGIIYEHGVVGWETAQTRNERIQVLNVVYCCEDAYRLETLQNGDWCYLGVIAKAEIQMTEKSPLQTIRSGGLWGIESDYVNEITKEQLEELRGELESLGFGKRSIDFAFKNVTEKS